MKRELIQMFKEITLIISKRSTCCRKQVGSIIVREGRIISTGWNGTASKTSSCKDYFEFKIQSENLNREEYFKSQLFLDEHREFSNLREIHGECNCIIYAKQDLSDTELFCSLSPCINCAKIILAAGIKTVYYIEEYDREKLGLELLKNNNIKVFKI